MKVSIDCGHGGQDSGAAGSFNGLFESHAVLDIGLRLRALLETHVEVQMIREDDTFVSLPERCRMANEWGADIFVSLHLNSATSDASGFEIFTAGYTKSKELAKKVASRHTAAFPEQRDRGIKTAGFYVLVNTNMPAILTEGCFLSNEAENKWVSLDETRQAMGEVIAQGILDYFGIESSKPALTLEERVVRIEDQLNLNS
jgi:N-acetylmuramoyl-L-alanine amidase